MKKATLLRRARLLVIPAIIAGMVAAQSGTAKECLEKGKCYKLIFHPT